MFFPDLDSTGTVNRHYIVRGLATLSNRRYSIAGPNATVKKNGTRNHRSLCPTTTHHHCCCCIGHIKILEMFAGPFALMSIFTRCTLYTLLLALYTSMWIRGGTNKNKPASQSPSSLPLPHMCTYICVHCICCKQRKWGGDVYNERGLNNTT